jgi:hypothetical protein
MGGFMNFETIELLFDWGFEIELYETILNDIPIIGITVPNIQELYAIEEFLNENVIPYEVTKLEDNWLIS